MVVWWQHNMVLGCMMATYGVMLVHKYSCVQPIKTGRSCTYLKLEMKAQMLLFLIKTEQQQSSWSQLNI